MPRLRSASNAHQRRASRSWIIPFFTCRTRTSTATAPTFSSDRMQCSYGLVETFRPSRITRVLNHTLLSAFSCPSILHLHTSSKYLRNRASPPGTIRQLSLYSSRGGSTCVYRAVKRLWTMSSNQAASVYLAMASEPGLAPKRLWPCGQSSRTAHQRPTSRPDVVATPLRAAPTEHPSFCAIFP